MDLRSANARSFAVVRMSAEMITFDFLASATVKSCFTTGWRWSFARSANESLDLDDILMITA
jgi:hypothetical protein